MPEAHFYGSAVITAPSMPCKPVNSEPYAERRETSWHRPNSQVAEKSCAA